MKPVDQLYSGADKNSPQNERTQDSPKEHTMLLLFRNGEVIEDDEENKEIVDAQGELDYIAGNELEAGLTALPEIQNGGEGSRLCDVHEAPAKRLTELNDVARPVKDAQVDDQHGERENVETNPEIEQDDAWKCQEFIKV